MATIKAFFRFIVTGLCVLFDVATFVLWAAASAVVSTFALAWGLVGTLLFWGITAGFAIAILATLLAVVVGTPFGFLGVVDTNKIWEILKELTGLAGLHVLNWRVRQSTEDTPEGGVWLGLLITREEYFSLRAAANLLGLWFKSVRYEAIGTKFAYNFFVVPARGSEDDFSKDPTPEE